MWNLKNKLNNKSRNKLIDTENILRATRWEGVGRTARKGKRIKRYKWIVAD